MMAMESKKYTSSLAASLGPADIEKPAKPINEQGPKPEKYAHPAGDVRYGGLRQVGRVLIVATYFFVTCLVIISTQLIGAPLYFFSKPAYYSWMARTKAHYGVLSSSIAQWWSPTVIRVTGDRTVRDQIRVTQDGRLECDFPERMVLIANHQLYSDWLYLWWIAYCARMHGFLYIIMKESLKNIPILGLGTRFDGFIFMARKWEADKPRMQYRLSKLSAQPNEPMWLLIFPEGTNTSNNGRNASRKFADKVGIPDPRHVLLPRTTGLHFCLGELKKTVHWIYDCTVAYEGIPDGQYGQDYFTLYSTFFEGRPPKSVNMHFRRWRISDLPSDEKEFEGWLRQRWYEKDALIEHYMQNGRFPEDDGVEGEGDVLKREEDYTLASVKRMEARGEKAEVSLTSGGKGFTPGVGWTGPITTEVRVKSWWEIIDIYSALAALGLIVHIGRTIFRIVGIITGTAAVAEQPHDVEIRAQGVPMPS